MKRELNEIEFSVLENGFDFIYEAAMQLARIQLGHANSNSLNRILKYAVMNLSSGIELVFKHVLLDAHWTYVFQDMNKADKDAFTKGDFKSVDSETAVERLKKFCKIELTQKERVSHKRLREYRNKIEHFDFKVNIKAIEKVIHDCISLIIKFICDHSNQTDYSSKEETLLHDIKRVIVQLDEYYEEAIKLAKSEIKRTGIKDIRDCPECGEHFFVINEDVSSHCFFCEQDLDEIATAKYLADLYIEDTLRITYRDVHKGEEYPLYECPDCENETFVIDGEKGVGICFLCKIEHSTADIEFCCECGTPFFINGEWSAICNSCFAEKMKGD